MTSELSILLDDDVAHSDFVDDREADDDADDSDSDNDDVDIVHNIDKTELFPGSPSELLRELRLEPPKDTLLQYYIIERGSIEASQSWAQSADNLFR